jgi:hypothetical protein
MLSEERLSILLISSSAPLSWMWIIDYDGTKAVAMPDSCSDVSALG